MISIGKASSRFRNSPPQRALKTGFNFKKVKVGPMPPRA